MPDQTTDAPGARPRAPEPHALGAAQVDQLAAMVLELAAQLHEERARVRVLEHHLRQRDLIPDGEEYASAAEAPDLRASLGRDLDRSLAALLAVITERDDARAPLQGESSGPAGVRS